jgi:pimeloyl-ACP methyl ester carboxylesterase
MLNSLLRGILLTPLLLGAVPAQAQMPGPAGDAFYTAPSPLPSGSAQSVIWSRPLTGTMALTGAARNTLVLYRSTNPGGRPVAVSGSISMPRGTPPAGGWPVIAWTHGTTGIAPICGPSRDTADGPEHPYIAHIATLLEHFINAGFAIVATDYQGLGAGDFHPFLQGVPNARNALDMIRAARELEPSLGSRFTVMGHSQGGHAALFTAAEAPRHAPELQLLGTIAMAPGSQIAARLAAVMASPRAELALPYVLYVLQSYAMSFPEIDLTRILTPQAIAHLPDLRVQCMTHALSTGYWATAIARDQFLPNAALGPFLAIAARNEPGGLRITTPTLVMQGGDDVTVRPQDTDATMRRLCAANTPLNYSTFPGVDHNGVMVSGAGAALAWMQARFAGQPAASNCASLPQAGG